jgi:RNA ligase
MLAAQKAFLDGTLNRKYVSVVKHPELDLWILNYTAICQFERAWDAVTTTTRGLILDSQGRIMARAFPKFFNLGERPETLPEALPNESFTVFEKIDGSLGIPYLGTDKRLRIATRGSFTGTQTVWANNWLRTLDDRVHALLVSVIQQGMTPVFEIVFTGNEGPVIRYDWEGLSLLGLIETETGNDRPWQDVQELAMRLGLRTPQVYNFCNFLDVLAQKPLLPVNAEGFVVRFASGLRIKVKGDQYSELFRAVNNFSARVVLEAMQNRREDFFVTLPEELRPQAEAFRAAINEQVSRWQAQAAETFASAPKLSRKEFALWVRANLSPEMQSVLFQLWDGREPAWYKLVDLKEL